MVNQKLAILLAMVITLAQSGSAKSEPLQIASMIGNPELTTAPKTSEISLNHASETSLNNAINDYRNTANSHSNSDIYTVGSLASNLPTIIQVLPQQDTNTSLFVNGSEVLRLHGNVAGQSSYQRVKAMADRLNHLLTTHPENTHQIRPGQMKQAGKPKNGLAHAGENPMASILYGHESLLNVDALTARMAKSSESELAFLYTNRLRRALGAPPLRMMDLTPGMSNLAQSAPNSKGHFKSSGHVQTGMASWYGPHFHGRRAADGSRFNQFAFTAAHRTLPFGTLVKVVNQHTRKSCLVKITDRGPYAAGRIIDLSRKAAESLGMLGSGVARVSLEIVSRTE